MSTTSSSSSSSSSTALDKSSNEDLVLEKQNNLKNQNIEEQPKKQEQSAKEQNTKKDYQSPYDNKSLAWLDKYFEISQRDSSFTKEILGGIAMFLASLYILSVQSSALKSGGTPESGTRQSTALLSGLGTITMGIVSGIPLMVSTGMGENYFYSTTIIAKHNYSWQTAGSLVFIQGILIVLISWRFLRLKFLSAIPPMFRIGIAFGISLLIGTLGIKSMINNPVTSEPELHFRLLLAVLCLVFIASFAIREKIYVFILAPFVTAIVSQIIRAASGDFEMAEWDLSGLGSTAFKINFDWKVSALWLIPVMTINQLFDAVCTILTVIQFAYLDKIKFDEKKFLNLISQSKTSKLQRVIIVTGIWSSISGLFCNSQIVPFIESIVAGTVGARTGFSSVITGLCFLLSIFLYPIISLIPNESTAPLMVYTTAIVIKMITHVDFSDLNSIIPIVVSTITIPLMSSILMGIALGYAVLILLWLVAPDKKYKEITYPMVIVFILSVVGVVFELLE
ncbi:xanthine/uracil permease [Anaeramoeba flamelloides]|uniref:Xanthine/uracil permease n=1 Tax=Anaeramoeba flamelloides TaxID=1746091 RepID=A0AAV7ZW68_9EUKA|nr:xanthine/uracil permease [Anaeramoeba flamelloides]